MVLAIMVSHLPATGGMLHCGYYLAILPPKRASSFSESLKGTFGDFGGPKKKVSRDFQDPKKEIFIF